MTPARTTVHTTATRCSQRPDGRIERPEVPPGCSAPVSDMSSFDVSIWLVELVIVKQRRRHHAHSVRTLARCAHLPAAWNRGHSTRNAGSHRQESTPHALGLTLHTPSGIDHRPLCVGSGDRAARGTVSRRPRHGPRRWMVSGSAFFSSGLRRRQRIFTAARRDQVDEELSEQAERQELYGHDLEQHTGDECRMVPNGKAHDVPDEHPGQ